MKPNYLIKIGELNILIEKLIHHIRSFFASDSRAVIALSGGLDSVSSLYLLKESIGADRITAFHLPSELNKEAEYNNFLEVVTALNITNFTISLKDVVTCASLQLYEGCSLNPANRAFGKVNLGFALRKAYLITYAKSQLADFRLVGNLDKTENYTGNFPKNCNVLDIAPLLDIYRTQLRGIAQILGIPTHIINMKTPCNSECSQIDSKFRGGDTAIDFLLYLHEELQMSKEEVKAYILAHTIPIDLSEIEFFFGHIEKQRHKRNDLHRGIPSHNLGIDINVFTDLLKSN